MDTLLSPLIHVALPAAVMLQISQSGLLSPVSADLGFQHYAEQPYPALPQIMPLNCLVNLAYCMFGLAWLVSTHQAVRDGIITSSDRYYFHVLSWVAVIYGPIQLMRLVTQQHEWAVLDQWITLPGFSWIVSWSLHICLGTGGVVNLVITLASMTSYLLALKSPFGFEIALAAHVVSAVVLCSLVYQRYPSDGARNAFVLAFLCCLGFVVLKLADLHLPDYSSFFKVISGHFLSKICDVFQIHFVAEFFYCVLRAKYQLEKRE